MRAVAKWRRRAHWVRPLFKQRVSEPLTAILEHLRARELELYFLDDSKPWLARCDGRSSCMKSSAVNRVPALVMGGTSSGLCLSAPSVTGSSIELPCITLDKSAMWGFKNTLRQLATAAAVIAARVSASHSAERWEGLADTVFQHLAHDNELPNAAIPTSATQDGDGFLWIGSQNGLARWDGYHFRLYRADPGKPGALPDNFIQTLLTDSRGVLWIGTTSGGLARYDREHDQFVSYPAGKDGLSHVSVRAIADDGEWRRVGRDLEGGLDHVHGQLRRSSSICTPLCAGDDPSSLPDNRVRGLLRDRHGTLVGQERLTALVEARQGSSTRIRAAYCFARASQGKGLPSPWSFLEDTAGRIWVGTLRQGAYASSTSPRRRCPCRSRKAMPPIRLCKMKAFPPSSRWSRDKYGSALSVRGS